MLQSVVNKDEMWDSVLMRAIPILLFSQKRDMVANAVQGLWSSYMENSPDFVDAARRIDEVLITASAEIDVDARRKMDRFAEMQESYDRRFSSLSKRIAEIEASFGSRRPRAERAERSEGHGDESRYSHSNRPSARREKVYQLALAKGSVNTRDAANATGCNMSTAARDLEQLEAENKLIKVDLGGDKRVRNWVPAQGQAASAAGATPTVRTEHAPTPTPTVTARGVSISRGGKYEAHYWDGRKVHIGTYNTLDEAINARAAAMAARGVRTDTPATGGANGINIPGLTKEEKEMCGKVLAYIDGHDGVKTHDIMEMTGEERNYVRSRVIRPMVKHGYIKLVTRGPSDPTAYYVRA